MRTTFETLIFDSPSPHIGRVTLNRPEVANAVNTRMGLDLVALWNELGADREDYRCIIMTGAGGRAFCAGGDLKERLEMSNEQWTAQHRIIEAAVRAQLACRLPVIAAVNGAAYGGGLELALCCDFIYAADTARFALPEVSIGIIPGAGGTQNLARALGERRAKELILTGKSFDATEAAAWKLVNRVVKPERLMQASIETGEQIVANAPLAVRCAKDAIHRGLQCELAEGMRLEIALYDTLIASDDRREGVRSFSEKRAPRFSGR